MFTDETLKHREVCFKIIEAQRQIFIDQKGYAPDTVYTSKKIRDILLEGNDPSEKLYLFDMEIVEHWCMADNGCIILRYIDIHYLPSDTLPPGGPDF